MIEVEELKCRTHDLLFLVGRLVIHRSHEYPNEIVLNDENTLSPFPLFPFFLSLLSSFLSLFILLFPILFQVFLPLPLSPLTSRKFKWINLASSLSWWLFIFRLSVCVSKCVSTCFTGFRAVTVRARCPGQRHPFHFTSNHFGFEKPFNSIFRRLHQI